MNAKWNAKGAITPITHRNATTEMARQFRNIIITAARTVEKGVVDVEQHESWQGLMIHTVHHIRYVGKGIEGLQKMREEFEAEKEDMVIPTQVRILANPGTIRERRQNREIATSLVVFVVNGRELAQSFVRKLIKVAEVWYQVDTYTNEGHDSRCELWCGWGHIENEYGSTRKCRHCSGHHWTSDHKCNVVGCTAKQGSFCGHTLEKCPNWKGNHIVFSSRCVKKREATVALRQSRMMGLAG